MDLKGEEKNEEEAARTILAKWMSFCWRQDLHRRCEPLRVSIHEKLKQLSSRFPVATHQDRNPPNPRNDTTSIHPLLR